MSEREDEGPGLLSQGRRIALTGMSALHNRGELFLVELRQETNRVVELFIWAALAFVLGLLFLSVLTAATILLFPSEQRMYVAGGFAVLYLAGAVLAGLNLRALLRDTPLPFSGTLGEARKDREWFESLK